MLLRYLHACEDIASRLIEDIASHMSKRSAVFGSDCCFLEGGQCRDCEISHDILGVGGVRRLSMQGIQLMLTERQQFLGISISSCSGNPSDNGNLAEISLS